MATTEVGLLVVESPVGQDTRPPLGIVAAKVGVLALTLADDAVAMEPAAVRGAAHGLGLLSRPRPSTDRPGLGYDSPRRSHTPILRARKHHAKGRGAEDRPPRRDISVYTGAMKVVKVRRVGNSNVVSIPKELEAIGYTPGSSVLVEELPDGELRILPTDHVRERIREVGRRVVAEHPEALQILADHDPDAEPPAR